MKWKYCDSNGKVSKENTIFQIDEVGNIVQSSGAVKANSCQKCKKKFNYKPTISEIKQPVPFYNCLDCNFENSSSGSALDHKIETDHKIKKTNKTKVVGFEKKILGSTANIIKTKNDIIILCGECN